MTTLLIVLAVIVVLGLGAGFAVRNRRSVIEPPSTRRAPFVDSEPEPDAAMVAHDEEVRAEIEAELLERAAAPAPTPAPAPDVAVDARPDSVVERPRLRDRLGKARAALSGAMGSLAGRSRLDDEAWDGLEEALILADVGVASTQELLESLRSRVRSEGIDDGDALVEALKGELRARLSGFDRDLRLTDDGPTVWLFVGVNGVGKTTTIGKLAAQQTAEGRRVLLAAGDTFRAAAAEQLGMWADRSGAEIVRGAEGSDPSAVIHDAVAAAGARGVDVVLADTAGRLHTKVNLMEELGKVRRVADRGDGTVTEVLLVIDATTGQNGLVQARQFSEAVDVTGVVLTKLDGSAKGGIVIAIHDQLGIPVKVVGVGEGIGDLMPFDADEYVDALFA
ncbi:MAG: signal recognition particle-docking protein FtsY [Acidimicrobiia bacterium]